MTDATLQDAIEDDYETELSRLGSSKALYALTGGEMETDAVLAALVAWSAAAADVFEEWTDDTHGDLFDRAAGTARDHADRIAETADGDPSEVATADAEADQVVDVLEVQDDPDARLGALLAWTMVTDRTLAQAVGFFVGNADTTAADLFRGLRSDVDDRREDALEGLDGADRDVARAAGDEVVEAAYDQYVQRLEGMGVKVKPVC